MGAVNSKSTAVSNEDARPKVLNSPYFDDGEIRACADLIAALVTDTAGSIYRFVRIPSGARISKLRFFNDAMAGTTSVKLGVYQTADNGGAVVSDNLFATALDIHLAGAGQELLFQNLSIAQGEKRLWELLGLSADPYLEYDICLTTVTQAGAAGNMLLQSEFVI